MADDRLDDAIAAVTRAVDRIEAVTRGAAEEQLPSAPAAPLPPQPRMPPPPAFSSGAAGFAARPTTALDFSAPEPVVDPSWSDYEPPLESDLPYAPDGVVEPESSYEPGPPHAPQQAFAPEPPFVPQPSFVPDPPYAPEPPLMLQQQFEPEPYYPTAPEMPPAPEAIPPIPPVPVDASAEVHELVGRIVARTQALEDHLEAARQLRSEISELVSRLAAAADRERDL